MMETVMLLAIQACSAAGVTSHTAGGGGGSGPSLSGFDLTGLLVWFVVVAVFAAGVTLACVIANRLSDRPRLVPIPVTAPISPDGHYWWDGAAWRPRV